MAPSVALVALTASTSLLLVGAIAVTLYIHRERIQDALQEFQNEVEVRHQHWMRESGQRAEQHELSRPGGASLERDSMNVDSWRHAGHGGESQTTLLDFDEQASQQAARHRQGFTQEVEQSLEFDTPATQEHLLSRASSFAVVNGDESEPSDFTDSDDDTFKKSM
ncbi:hypothetical protein BCR37DRAFT_395476 [Protomyces lactucae-debilis]|uniref:Uncharacterized protein n=1 Tax=Protomyces lactucae-debilis TaxID=2754530 RepID=A0A1Y2EW37_PROLT|nr:uncharacterized protein BCR37DRAFT_395476 [Protomyces lactucae-debilis]ORY75799.1 hypothetical protein BCR37DRAFT_395476 [Protomyces lactucae-debilis]